MFFGNVLIKTLESKHVLYCFNDSLHILIETRWFNVFDALFQVELADLQSDLIVFNDSFHILIEPRWFNVFDALFQVELADLPSHLIVCQIIRVHLRILAILAQACLASIWCYMICIQNTAFLDAVANKQFFPIHFFRSFDTCSGKWFPATSISMHSSICSGKWFQAMSISIPSCFLIIFDDFLADSMLRSLLAKIIMPEWLWPNSLEDLECCRQ